MKSLRFFQYKVTLQYFHFSQFMISRGAIASLIVIYVKKKFDLSIAEIVHFVLIYKTKIANGEYSL